MRAQLRSLLPLIGLLPSFSFHTSSKCQPLFLTSAQGALSLRVSREISELRGARLLCRMSGGGDEGERKTAEEEQDAPPENLEAAAASWDQYADDWDGMAGPESWWAQDSAKQIDALLPSGAAGLAGKSVLEFGCGTGVIGLGLVLRAGQGCTVTLSDIAPKMVENARKKAAALPGGAAERVTAVAGDVLEEEALAPGPYDLVVSGSVLTFLPDARTAVKKLRGRMSSGGQMIHFVWKRPAEKQQREGSHQFWDGFTAEELTMVLAEGGMERVEVRDFKFRMGEEEEKAMAMLVGTGYVP